MQYCRSWKDLSRVLGVSYNTIKQSLIPKIRKYDIIQNKDNILYINANIVKMTEKANMNYVVLDKSDDTMSILDLDTNLIYKLKFE